LRTRRLRGVRSTQKQEPAICASANGPLLVTGGVRVLDAGGNVLYEGERAALCRCGGSSNKPFCDGTHRTNGFRA
jgi:CDGSH-type Zn-finger protein